MERDELIDLLTQELSADPDNNRLNRILEAADQYAEQLVSESIDNYKTAVIDSIINAINSVVVMSHTGPWKPGEEQLIMREFDEWEAEEARELSLGERISMCLEERGMSQKDLAKAANLREVTVSRYISNTRIPNANILLQIARALNVSTDELLGNEQSSSSNVPDTNVGKTQLSEKDTTDLIYRKDAIEVAKAHWYKPDIPQALAELPPAQSPPISEAYAKAVRSWLVNYQVKLSALDGRYTPYEVLGWVVSDWRKENGIDGLIE